MKTLHMLLAAMLLTSSVALAADPVPAPKATPKPDTTKAAPAANTPAASRSASGPVKVAATGSQQNRMRECNKSATGKKGAERKTFMKACLSTHKG